MFWGLAQQLSSQLAALQSVEGSNGTHLMFFKTWVGAEDLIVCSRTLFSRAVPPPLTPPHLPVGVPAPDALVRYYFVILVVLVETRGASAA